MKRKEEKMPDFHKQKPTGFISVTNGCRVMLNKVTVEPAGMKVMVRNDAALAKVPTKQANKQNLQNSERKGLRITMTNPQALKKPQKPAKQNTMPIRKVPRKRPITQTRQLPPSPINVIQTQQTAVLKPKPFAKQAKRLRLAQNRPRPMISTKENDTTQKPAQKETPQIETEVPGDISSPFEGTKIIVSNLHPVVVEEDILELFSVLGPVRRARLIGSGKAEIVFIRRDDAIRAYQKYNNRDLDGQPMRMKLLLQERVPQPAMKYTWQSEIKSNPKKGSEIIEIEANTLQRALFKGGSTGSSTRPVVFTVKI
uniref:Serine/arginine repetitive matrix protein 1 n=1 Tax=Phallusia mammillata TaxID=59560 RepID=A0A6F9DT27_9ASCI|nr:serine/arginine repetitive matrix protein 1 [Phallusia mammillata]